MIALLVDFPELDKFAGVLDWPVLGLLVRLLVFGAIAVLLTRLHGYGLRLLWASGADRRRRLGATGPAFRLLLAVGVVLVALEPLYRTHPANAAALGLLLLIMTATWGLREFQNIVAGLTIAITHPLRIGDEAECGPYRGVVERLGLTRVTLQAANGSRVEVPTGELTRLGIHTADSGKALPVAFDVQLPPMAFRAGEVPAEALTALRDQLLLSTWVDVDAPVLISHLGRGVVRIEATPTFSDEGTELESDLRARTASIGPSAHANLGG